MTELSSCFDYNILTLVVKENFKMILLLFFCIYVIIEKSSLKGGELT